MPTEVIRILCVHGVGGHPVGGKWESDWADAIHAGLDTGPREPQPLISYVHYDDISDRYPISAMDVLEAMGKLAISGITAPFRRTRGLGDNVRLTAVMVVQWVENDAFRRETRERLVEAITEHQPDVILGHSLGSLDPPRHVHAQIDRRTGRRADIRLTGLADQQPLRERTVPRGTDHAAAERDVAGTTSSIRKTTSSRRRFASTRHRISRRCARSSTSRVGRPRRGDVPAQPEHGHSRAWRRIAPPGDAADRDSLAALGSTREVPRRAAPLLPTRRRALLIGINEYPSAADRLEGCVNDVFLVSALLQEPGFEPEDIRVVLDERATAAGIRDRLDWLLDDVNAGDVRVLYYSGHGAQMPVYGASARTITRSAWSRTTSTGPRTARSLTTGSRALQPAAVRRTSSPSSTAAIPEA